MLLSYRTKSVAKYFLGRLFVIPSRRIAFTLYQNKSYDNTSHHMIAHHIVLFDTTGHCQGKGLPPWNSLEIILFISVLHPNIGITIGAPCNHVIDV